MSELSEVAVLRNHKPPDLKKVGERRGGYYGVLVEKGAGQEAQRAAKGFRALVHPAEAFEADLPGRRPALYIPGFELEWPSGYSAIASSIARISCRDSIE